MKVYNKILENLHNGIKLSDLDDDTIEEVICGGTVRLFRCDDCFSIFKETDSITTNMEMYYGISQDFPNSTYIDLAGCPYCKSTDISDLGLFELHDFEDYEELTESTKWKHISGPHYKYMDMSQYQGKITSELAKLLNNYDIRFISQPVVDTPGKQSYVGFDKDDNKIVFNFYNQHEDKLDNREGKDDMLVTINYNGETVEAGVIQLKNLDSISNAFEIITMTLEDLGFKLKGQEDKKEDKEEKVSKNSDLENLVKFRNSLSEQEELELND